MTRYSLDELKKKLADPGWRALTGGKADCGEGTLGQLAEAAHARHKKGHAAGTLQEIETRIEVDLMQLEALWLHMGLPLI